MLRVCVDARLSSGSSGGIESVVIGLAYGLSKLNDGNEQYYFLAYPGDDQWIRPYLSGPCSIIHTSQTANNLNNIKKLLGKLPLVAQLYQLLPTKINDEIPRSDGTIEKTGIHVMHFPFQSGFLTKIPSIYHPHDLQHLHLPQFFTPKAVKVRDQRYRTMCSQSDIVCVTSNWVKQDLIKHYQLPEQKIKIIVLPPVLNGYQIPSQTDVEYCQTKYGLSKPFIFYPAQTWPHKNHLGLLESLAILRDLYGIKVNFISSGRLNDHYRAIKTTINKLNLSEQVKFLGFVSEKEIYCLYKLCRLVVVPSLFEAMSGPVGEAFAAGRAVACSNVTSLPEQVGNAALIFNPDRPEEMAKAIYQLWTDEKLRSELSKRGEERIKNASWEKTARIFRAHYRYLGNRPLSDEDTALLKNASGATRIYDHL